MTDLGKNREEVAASRKWGGLDELDRALAENRLTEYRIRDLLGRVDKRGIPKRVEF